MDAGRTRACPTGRIVGRRWSLRDRRPRGQLEGIVMRALWEADGALSARDVLGRFEQGEVPALTTVLTVLERLRAKGHVVRTSADDGTARFAPAQPEPSFVAANMLTVLTDSQDRGAALLHFAGHLRDEDAELLRRALGSSQRTRSVPDPHASQAP
nr:BlaI/MecI/CopY family transcriptional regulator [Sinomonas humi]